MSELPQGWRETNLGSLGKYHNGRGFKKSEWRDQGRPIIRIQNLTGSSDSFNYYQGDADERHVARQGDLLMSWAATLGAYIWTGPESVVNQHIFKVESNIDRKFHKYLLDFKLEELRRQAHGSGMVHITRAKFEGLLVQVPESIAMQRRIVAILEDHLSRLDAAEHLLVDSCARLSNLQERLISSALLGEAAAGRRSAVMPAPCGTDDGRLVDLPVGWGWQRLGKIARVVGGITKDAKKQSDPKFVEVPYLRVANVQRGRLDLSHVTTIRAPAGRAEALRLLPGDVLMNEGGDRDKLARGWVWSGEIDNCIHQNHVFRARVIDRAIEPRLLAWAANTIGSSWAQRNGKQSVNLASISLSKIRQMPIPVPPVHAQATICARLDNQLAAVDRLEASLQAASLRSIALRRALLSAAFTGGLAGAASDTEVVHELVAAGSS